MPKPAPTVPMRPERREPLDIEVLYDEPQSKNRPPVPSRGLGVSGKRNITTAFRPVGVSTTPAPGSLPSERNFLDMSARQGHREIRNITVELASPRSRVEQHNFPVSDNHNASNAEELSMQGSSPTAEFDMRAEYERLLSGDVDESPLQPSGDDTALRIEYEKLMRCEVVAPEDYEPYTSLSNQYDLRAEYEKLMRGDDEPPDEPREVEQFDLRAEYERLIGNVDEYDNGARNGVVMELNEKRLSIVPEERKSCAKKILDLNLAAYGGLERRVGRILSISDDDFTAEKIFDFNTDVYGDVEQQRAANAPEVLASEHFRDIPFLDHGPILDQIPGIYDPHNTENPADERNSDRSTPKFDVFGEFEDLGSIAELGLLNYDNFGFTDWAGGTSAEKTDETTSYDLNISEPKMTTYNEDFSDYFGNFVFKLDNSPSHDSRNNFDKSSTDKNTLISSNINYDSYNIDFEPNWATRDTPPQDVWPPEPTNTEAQSFQIQSLIQLPAEPKITHILPIVDGAPQSYLIPSKKSSLSSSSSSGESSERPEPNIVDFSPLLKPTTQTSPLTASSPKTIPVRTVPSSGHSRSKPLPPPPRSPPITLPSLPLSSLPPAGDTITTAPLSPSSASPILPSSKPIAILIPPRSPRNPRLRPKGVCETGSISHVPTGSPDKPSPVTSPKAQVDSLSFQDFQAKTRDWPPKKEDNQSAEYLSANLIPARQKFLAKSYTTGSAPEPSAISNAKDSLLLNRNMNEDGTLTGARLFDYYNNPNISPTTITPPVNKGQPPAVPKRIDFTIPRAELQRSVTQGTSPTPKKLSISDVATFSRIESLDNSAKAAFTRNNTTVVPKMVSFSAVFPI